MTRERGDVVVAAALAVFGLPVERYLTTTDRDERVVLASLVPVAARLVDTLQRNQAIYIAKLMNTGRL